MTDYEQMANMVSGPSPKELLFKDSQLEALNDSNNSVYTNGQINFDTLSLVSKYISWREAYLQVPVTINITGALAANNCLGVVTGSTLSASGNLPAGDVVPAGKESNTGGTVTLGAACSVALRQSILNLITGVTISLGDSTNIVSELNSPYFINNMRMLIQNDDEWKKTFAPELCFEKDVAFTNSSNTGFNTRQGYLLDISNVTYYCLDQAAGGAAAYISSIQTLFNIPLRYLHSFFDNLDFPSKGIRWMFGFNLSKEFNAGALYPAFSFATTIPAGVTYRIGGGTTVAKTSYNACALKYRSVELPDHFQTHISELALKGNLNERYIKYALTELYNNVTNSASGLNSHQVSTGLTKPIRMWFFGCPTGNLQSQLNTIATGMSLQSLNTRINGTNRFNMSLQTAYDMWEEVQQQMECVGHSPDKGSLVTYADFFNPTGQSAVNQLKTLNGPKGLYAWYCIDLARLQKRVDDSAVSLILDSIRNDANGSLDYIILIEREMTCKVQFDKNSAVVVIGNNV